MFGRDAINYHLMKKQGLIDPYPTPAEALNALGVIDAMILPAALYSLFIRSKNSSAAAIAREVQSGRRMARVPGLKGALQIVPRDLMTHVYTFTKDDREDRARAMLTSWGIEAGEYKLTRQAIRDSLGDKEKTLSQLKNSLPANMARDVERRRGRRVEKSTNIAIVAQAMWQRWELLRGGIGRDTFEDPGRYSLFERRFGVMNLDEPRTDAIQGLARTYIERYGPTSPEDFAWWAGMKKGDATAVFEQMSGIVPFEIQGIEGRFYVAGIESPEAGRQLPFPARLLPTDDPYVKAYSHRGRFVPQLYQSSVITKFGESSPVVLIDGIVHGFWSIDGRTCVVEMVAGPEGNERAIRAAAENVGRFFTGGPVDIIFTAFRQKA
ncbi:MAG TPA: winged helix DNA-binding domain-containing protein [Methanocella sp.]|jgi:hypothetical protein